MLTIYLVRHGQTINNMKGLISGHSDSPLTSIGRERIEIIAKKLLGIKFDYIYSSDLKRAITTAQILAARLNLSLRINQVKELREIDYGVYTGRKKSEVIKECPNYKKDIDFIFPQGESFSQLQSRVVGFVKKLEKLHNKKTVMLVTHAGAIRALKCYFNKGNFSDYLQMKISGQYIERFVLNQDCLISDDSLKGSRSIGFDSNPDSRQHKKQ